MAKKALKRRSKRTRPGPRKVVAKTKRKAVSGRSDALDLRPLASEIGSILSRIDQVGDPSQNAMDLRQRLRNWLNEIEVVSGPTGLVWVARDAKEHIRQQQQQQQQESESDYGGPQGFSGHGSGGGGLE